jgi:hypothetical protein
MLCKFAILPIGLSRREYCAKDSPKNHFKHYLPVKIGETDHQELGKTKLNVQKFNFACPVIGQKFSTLIKSPLGMEQEIKWQQLLQKNLRERKLKNFLNKLRSTRN